MASKQGGGHAPKHTDEELKAKGASAMSRFERAYKDAGGKSIQPGWTINAKERETGVSKGDIDYTYVSPEGKRFRAQRDAVAAMMDWWRSQKSAGRESVEKEASPGPATRQGLDSANRSGSLPSKEKEKAGPKEKEKAGASTGTTKPGGSSAASKDKEKESKDSKEPTAGGKRKAEHTPGGTAADGGQAKKKRGRPSKAERTASEAAAATAAPASVPTGNGGSLSGLQGPLPRAVSTPHPHPLKPLPKPSPNTQPQQAAPKRVYHSEFSDCSFSLGSRASQLFRELEDDAESEISDVGPGMLAWRLARAVQQHREATQAALRLPSQAGDGEGEQGGFLGVLAEAVGNDDVEMDGGQSGKGGGEGLAQAGVHATHGQQVSEPVDEGAVQVAATKQQQSTAMEDACAVCGLSAQKMHQADGPDAGCDMSLEACTKRAADSDAGADGQAAEAGQTAMQQKATESSLQVPGNGDCPPVASNAQEGCQADVSAPAAVTKTDPDAGVNNTDPAPADAGLEARMADEEMQDGTVQAAPCEGHGTSPASVVDKVAAGTQMPGDSATATAGAGAGAPGPGTSAAATAGAAAEVPGTSTPGGGDGVSSKVADAPPEAMAAFYDMDLGVTPMTSPISGDAATTSTAGAATEVGGSRSATFYDPARPMSKGRRTSAKEAVNRKKIEEVVQACEESEPPPPPVKRVTRAAAAVGKEKDNPRSKASTPAPADAAKRTGSAAAGRADGDAAGAGAGGDKGRGEGAGGSKGEGRGNGAVRTVKRDVPPNVAAGRLEVNFDGEEAAGLLAESLAVAYRRRKLHRQAVAQRHAAHILRGVGPSMQAMVGLVQGLRAAGLHGEVLDDFSRAVRRVRGVMKLLTGVPSITELLGTEQQGLLGAEPEELLGTEPQAGLAQKKAADGLAAAAEPAAPGAIEGAGPAAVGAAVAASQGTAEGVVTPPDAGTVKGNTGVVVGNAELAMGNVQVELGLGDVEMVDAGHAEGGAQQQGLQRQGAHAVAVAEPAAAETHSIGLGVSAAAQHTSSGISEIAALQPVREQTEQLASDGEAQQAGNDADGNQGTVHAAHRLQPGDEHAQSSLESQPQLQTEQLGSMARTAQQSMEVEEQQQLMVSPQEVVAQ